MKSKVAWALVFSFVMPACQNKLANSKSEVTELQRQEAIEALAGPKSMPESEKSNAIQVLLEDAEINQEQLFNLFISEGCTHKEGSLESLDFVCEPASPNILYNLKQSLADYNYILGVKDLAKYLEASKLEKLKAAQVKLASVFSTHRKVAEEYVAKNKPKVMAKISELKNSLKREYGLGFLDEYSKSEKAKLQSYVPICYLPEAKDLYLIVPKSMMKYITRDSSVKPIDGEKIEEPKYINQFRDAMIEYKKLFEELINLEALEAASQVISVNGSSQAKASWPDKMWEKSEYIGSVLKQLFDVSACVPGDKDPSNPCY